MTTKETVISNLLTKLGRSSNLSQCLYEIFAYSYKDIWHVLFNKRLWSTKIKIAQLQHESLPIFDTLTLRLKKPMTGKK